MDCVHWTDCIPEFATAEYQKHENSNNSALSYTEIRGGRSASVSAQTWTIQASRREGLTIATRFNNEVAAEITDFAPARAFFYLLFRAVFQNALIKINFVLLPTL